MDPLDVDPFASADPVTRIDHLFRMRRATHRFIVRYGQSQWTREQRLAGRLTAPPAIAALPARQQPQALAADEAARLTHAHLYGLDETATTTAVTLGADMVDHIPSDARTGPHWMWTPVAQPPAETGMLRWASAIGYNSAAVPLVACHWGPVPQGTWLAWWADNRIAAHHDIAELGVTRHQARTMWQEIGPLASTEIATTITPWPHTDPHTDPSTGHSADPPAHDPPSPQDIAKLLALTATVMASWALLTTPGAAHLVTREPTPAQATRDRRAGLKPRPATLATEPIDTQIIKQLSTEKQP